MKIFQHVTLSDHPTFPMDAVTKAYVDNLVIEAGSAIGGGVFFTNIAPTSTGIVGSKEYVPGTIPANRVITDGTTDTPNVRVSLIAEGTGTFYSPTITVTTVPALPNTPLTVPLSEDASDKRFFTGVFDLTGVADGDYVITATSTTGAKAVATIHRAGVGPAVSTVTIGSLPGSQTEAKSGDIVQVSGTVPNLATYVEIIAGGAAGALNSQALGAADSAGPGLKTFSGTFTVGSGTGAQSVQARARNALGTYGVNVTSTNTIVLNQTFPAISARLITYSGNDGVLGTGDDTTTGALSGSQQARVAATITNFDTVAYTTSADLTVANPSTYAINKTVTRVNGSYVYGVNNYTITATKASNGAVSTATAAVTIANVAPTAAITIVGTPSRLQSTAAGTDYTVRITPNQIVNSTPTLVASSGTWQGSWVNSGNVWSRVLRIQDANPKGPQTFSGLQVNGLGGLIGNTITSGANYIVGGFPTRTITFPAFARFAPIGTAVTDITKVTASYTGAAALTRQTSTADTFQGFTIVDQDGNYSPTGSYLYISDAAFAGSNTTGTLQLDVTEAA